jgi:exosome complex component RRP46
MFSDYWQSAGADELATPSRALEASLVSSLTPLLALSQHPRSLIQIVIQSLSSPATTYHTAPPPDSDDPLTHSWPESSSTSAEISAPTPLGSLSFAERASALNAAALAILDAGAVSLRAVPIAVSLAYVPEAMYLDTTGQGGEERKVSLMVDPSAEEEGNASGRFVFGWAFGEGVSTGQKQRGEDVDMGGKESGEAELVWVESEGSFTKAQVRAS